MNVERVRNPAQKAAQLSGVACGSSSNAWGSSSSSNSNSSNSNSAMSQAGSLEARRQLYRQLSLSLPHCRDKS